MSSSLHLQQGLSSRVYLDISKIRGNGCVDVAKEAVVYDLVVHHMSRVGRHKAFSV